MAPLRIVTSTYRDEHILNLWINNIGDIPATVYVKDDNLNKTQSIRIDEKYVRICNYGRCDYAFLYYIIENYDELDDIIIFTKANWMMSGLNLADVLNNCQKYDFFESGALRKYQYWIEEDKNKSNFAAHEIERSYYIDNDYYSHDIQAYRLFKDVFGDIKPPSCIVGWGHFPCFSVSKRLIHRHPKSVYEKLISKFYPECITIDQEKLSKHPDNLNTYQKLVEDIGKYLHDYLGRFWYILFTYNIPLENYKVENRYI